MQLSLSHLEQIHLVMNGFASFDGCVLVIAFQFATMEYLQTSYLYGVLFVSLPLFLHSNGEGEGQTLHIFIS